MENAENSVFATQNKKYPRKSLFLAYFKVKFIIKNLRLVKFRQFGTGRPTRLISALSDIKLKFHKTVKITIAEFNLSENGKLATLH